VNRRDGFMRALVVVAAISVALSFSAEVALASTKTVASTQTTVPSRFIEMLVFIKDTGITVAYAGGSKSHDPNYPLYGPVPRGDTLTINIRNVGKKVHNFDFAGSKTKAIKPGKTAHLIFRAVARGVYDWRSTLDKGKYFHGTTTVA
jgi:Cupredoxin-like domain